MKIGRLLTLMLIASSWVLASKSNAETKKAIYSEPSAMEQALKYKQIIGNAEYISENDDTWSPFVSKNAVDSDLPPAQIQEAFETKQEIARIWTYKQIIKFLDGYISFEDYGPEFSQAYLALKQELLKDFSKIYMYKMETDEPAVFKVYLFGRRADGVLVGLTTTSIET